METPRALYSFVLFSFCLNRTMQYGNPKHKRTKKEIEDEFKSYYVVWKLERAP